MNPAGYLSLLLRFLFSAVCFDGGASQLKLLYSQTRCRGTAMIDYNSLTSL